MLNILDQAAILGELDDAAHAGQNDLGGVVGLGDKVHGPVAQGGQLRVPIRGEHDHRDAGQAHIRPQRLHQLKAVHHRHVDIQQDHGHRALKGAQLLQRFLAVSRKKHVILIL